MNPCEIYDQAINGLPTDFTPVVACPVCWRLYKDATTAQACAQSTPAPAAKVGDIVRVNIGYGWFDGLEHWMILGGGHKFHGKDTHAAYFIVTSVDQGNSSQTAGEFHRWLYSVRTLGVKNGNPDGMCGWISWEDRRAQVIKDPDPRLPSEGAQFLGQVYTRHL